MKPKPNDVINHNEEMKQIYSDVNIGLSMDEFKGIARDVIVLNNQFLKDYLLKEWKHNNHVKYHKYFNQWFDNLTEDQLSYFNKDMIKANKL